MNAPRGRDLAATGCCALALRLVVAAFAWNRFPPADDGVLYDALARRLALGAGYSWAWPDGTVTPVAHYPVGYPALLSVAYRALGAQPSAALLLHAVLGALGAVGVHVVASYGFSRPRARLAGLVVAVHPALLSYTPAIMTEGVCSAILAVPFALSLLARGPRRVGARSGLAALAGFTLGGACLVRPQAILLAPVVAMLAMTTAVTPRRVLAPWLVIVGAGLVLAPWTLRNERVFGRPILVSANAGWNLLIGADASARGGWRPLEVPASCREVWDEAGKDACFGRAARAMIARDPGAWLSLMPAKLAATFDLGGSGPSYLSRSRPDLVSRSVVLATGGVETLFERAALFVTLFACAIGAGPRSAVRRTLGLAFMLFALLPTAWPAYVGLAVLLMLGGRSRLRDEPLRLVTVAVLASTVVTHAVFFGAGRYALLVHPWIAALAVAAFPRFHRSSTAGHAREASAAALASTVTRSGASNAAMSAKCS